MMLERLTSSRSRNWYFPLLEKCEVVDYFGGLKEPIVLTEPSVEQYGNRPLAQPKGQLWKAPKERIKRTSICGTFILFEFSDSVGKQLRISVVVHSRS